LKDGLWGMINNDGVELIPPQFNAIEKMKDNCYKVYKDTKQGIVSKDGVVLVEPKYHAIDIF